MSVIERRGLLFCLLGPSGSGKSTLSNMLLKEFEGTIVPSISYTTREPREGEIHGQHYYFVSLDEFNVRKSKGTFFETEETHGNWYGTPKSPIDNSISSGIDLLLDIDIKGANSFKKAFPLNTVTLFLLPPSSDELKNRIQGRASISEEEIKIRLQTAQNEYKSLLNSEVDYCIVNASLYDTYNSVRSILIAERNRMSRLDSNSLQEFCKV
jgi:guanylate kinase